MLRTFATLALMFWVGGALAQDATAYHKRALERDLATFQQIDRDNSGRVSRQEAAGFVDFVARFDAIDVNRDNYVTRDELTAYHERLDPQVASAK